MFYAKVESGNGQNNGPRASHLKEKKFHIKTQENNFLL